MAFKKPEKTISGTRILIFGEAGTRKTRTALTFPNVAYIDSDQGADNYYEEFADNLALVSDSTTFSEVNDDLEEIEDIKDDIDTIVLDSITKIYENQQHTALRVVEQRARKNGRLIEGEGLSPKEWGVIKLNHEKMLSKLFEFKKDGKIIVVISEAKDEKEAIKTPDGQLQYRKIGISPNASKGIDFDFDIVLEMVKDENDNFLGAKVKKDRLGVIPEGEIVEDPGYHIWADAIEKKRKGTVKAKKRNFEEDIAKDEKSFSATSGNKVDDLKAEALQKAGALAPVKKPKLAAQLKTEFGTADFSKFTEEDKLKRVLDIINSL